MQHPGYAPPRFSPQESEYYQQLFAQADRDKRGALDGIAGAAFLTTSGVPQDVLHRIWDIADQDRQGVLTPDKFFVACRLVAHAQAGHAPAPQLALAEPQLLPDFQAPWRRSPSEASSGRPSPGASPSRSEASELMQPVIAYGEGVVRAAARAASRSPSPKVFTQPQWAPSQREKRKYATLFKRVDWDGDGYVQGSEASDLLARSRMPREALGIAWELADADADGRLNFREFVCLVHLVTCALRGAPMLRPREPLPPALRAALDNLESPDVLVAEREASRSRSTSPAPSGMLSPSGLLSPRQHTSTGMWFTEAPTTDAFGTTSSGGAFGGAGDLGFGDDELFGGPAKSKKDRKKSKDRRGDDDDLFGSPEAFAFGADDQPREPGRSRSGEFGDGRSFASDASPAFGGGGPGGREDDPAVVARLEEVSERFDAVMAADREVCRQLRREVDELQDELRHVRELERQLMQELRQDENEFQRAEQECKGFESRLNGARNRLLQLQENRRAMNLESLSLKRDREHFAEELEFLSVMAAEEEHMLETTHHANASLEQSYLELEGHAEQLELQRRSLVQQVHQERDLVRQEERRNAELRNRLEQLRRECAASAAKRRDAQDQVRRTREMQQGGVVPVAGRSAVDVSAFAKGHSWAQSLAVNSPNPSPPAQVAAARAPARIAGLWSAA